MNFELESLHSVYLLGALGIWAIYCAYRYSNIPTIKLWEVVLLSSITTFPMFMLPRIDGGDILWIVGISIIVLASSIFQSLKQKAVGTIGMSGYLRLIHMGTKSAKILQQLEDIKEVNQIVLSPTQLELLVTPPTSQTKELHEFVSTALQKDISIISLQKYLELNFGYTDVHEDTDIQPTVLLSSKVYRFFKKLSDTVLAAI